MSDVKKEKTWFPLESNPDIMNDYAQKMGFPVNQYCFHDVLSTEEWALEMVPHPALAVVMLFPIKEASEQHKEEEEERIDSEGQILSDNVYFMKQTIGNACGTIGILHALGNIPQDLVELESDKFLAEFLSATRSKNPQEIAAKLQEDEKIESIHSTAAEEGQSEQIESTEAPVNTHFICFTVVDNHLYELDGRKKFPINHGPSEPSKLLQDAVLVIKQFMERDPGEMRFTILALGPASEEN